MLQNLTLQNSAEKPGGAYMESTGRLIASKRALQFQFPKADVLSTASTVKTSWFCFFFVLSLLATAINVINSTSRKPPQRVGCEEIRHLLVLETIKFAIFTELLQSLLPEKFRDSKNKEAILVEFSAAVEHPVMFLPISCRAFQPDGITTGHSGQWKRPNSSGSRGSETEH